jgi:hypothetical protein
MWGQLRFLGTAAVQQQRRLESLERLYAAQRAAGAAARERQGQEGGRAADLQLEAQKALVAEREQRKAETLERERLDLYEWIQSAGGPEGATSCKLLPAVFWQ